MRHAKSYFSREKSGLNKIFRVQTGIDFICRCNVSNNSCCNVGVHRFRLVFSLFFEIGVHYRNFRVLVENRQKNFRVHSPPFPDWSVCLSSTLFYLEPSNAHLFGSLQCTWTPFHAQLFDPFQCTIIRRGPIQCTNIWTRYKNAKSENKDLSGVVWRRTSRPNQRLAFLGAGKIRPI